MISFYLLHTLEISVVLAFCGAGLHIIYYFFGYYEAVVMSALLERSVSLGSSAIAPLFVIAIFDSTALNRFEGDRFLFVIPSLVMLFWFVQALLPPEAAEQEETGV